MLIIGGNVPCCSDIPLTRDAICYCRTGWIALVILPSRAWWVYMHPGSGATAVRV